MSWPEPITLTNAYCTLVPLSHTHHDALVHAVKDGELWNLWFSSISHPDEMKIDIQKRLDMQQKGEMLPFVVIHNASLKVVGMTTYCHIDAENRRLDIGYTWYSKSHQRTALNTACKNLLLTHAFESLKCIAVGFRVDSMNHSSQRAVERIGAKYEGTIRNYSILPNGHIRDMKFYSIIASEWPKIKMHLNWLADSAHLIV